MRKRMNKLLINALVSGLLLSACNACTPDSNPESNIVTDTQPVEEHPWADWEDCSQVPGAHPCNFEFMDQNGEMVELYDHYNKVIVVDLSAMWCGVCNNIAAMGDQFVSDYGANNVIWLTVLVDDNSGNPPDLEDLQRWASLYNITGPVLGADRTLIDQTAQTGYPVTSWPTLVVIDREMVIRYGIYGWSETVVRDWVEELL